MGALLGQQTGRVVDISNCFEISFTDQPSGWHMNEAFFQRKQEQCASCTGHVTFQGSPEESCTDRWPVCAADKQTFAKLDVVGWYCTGDQPMPRHAGIHNKASACSLEGRR